MTKITLESNEIKICTRKIIIQEKINYIIIN